MTTAPRSFHIPGSKPHYLPQIDFKTEHVRIELALDFEKRSISGTCVLDIGPMRSGVSSIKLDACELDIRGVTIDGAAGKFEYDNCILSIDLPREHREKYSVMVEYSSIPRLGVLFTGPDREHPDKPVQAWTQGEAEFTRYWFPCPDRPNVKFSSELILTVPSGFRVISNGTIVKTEEKGKKMRVHWKEDMPHSAYLTSFVAGKFGELTGEADGVKLYYYFPESKRKDVMRYFGETPKMIEVFGELTGVRYPYKKYAQTTVEDFIWGAMENFNATTFSMTYYPDAGSEEDFQSSYASPHSNAVNLVAHELAHQWFGDLVTCADWSHTWLNEGFATYFQGLYLEKTRGADEMRVDIEMRAADYFKEEQERYRRPIVDRGYVLPDDAFDYTTYEKGASMIHELRFLMGDEAFFRGISEYLKTFAYGSVDTDDFLKSLEKSSGLSLREFFEQAFFKPGYPEFEVDYSWSAESSTATLRVRQVQNTEDGTPIFKLPCDFVFYVGDGRLQRRVVLDSADQTLAFPLPSRPTIVEFDPQRWIMKKTKFNKGMELLINQLAKSTDAWSRAEAAEELGKLRNNAVVKDLKAAASKEQFWHVRASAIAALGQIGTIEATKAILGIGLPDDRKVRRSIASALGNSKEEASRAQLIRMLEEDASPYVRCEAALALAKNWPQGAFLYLKKAMKTLTPNQTLSEACLEAMGKLTDEGVNELILKSLAYGKPTRVRIGALKAIRERGKILDDELSMLKTILAEDKEFRIRLGVLMYVVGPSADIRFDEQVVQASKSDLDPRVRRRALEIHLMLEETAEISRRVSSLKAEVDALKRPD